MTDRFIDNFTPGDGTDGLTWAKAELTAAAVDAADAAGDRWLFDYRHSESTAGAVALAVAGSLASTSQLLSVTQSGSSGVSSLTAGAIIATTGANAITINGIVYVYGITFAAGSGTSNGTVIMASADGNSHTYDSCKFTLGGSSINARVQFGQTTGATESAVTLLNPVFKFASTGQGLNVGNCRVGINGGSIDGAGSAITTFVQSVPANGANLLVNGFDFSNAATGVNLVAGGSAANGIFRFRHCKLPASWSGGLFASAPAHLGVRAEMLNCSSTDTNYALWVEDYAGSIKHETTLVKTGGASDGTTPISWKMVTSANAEYPAIILRSPEISIWNKTTGSAVTVTVDFLRDSATNLQDDEIWLEVEYLGTSGFPLAVFADDAAADVLATPADQATSAATWTTTGMSNPNEQKLSVTFTPQEKGLIIARVCMGVASTTVYVDPVLQVS